MRFVCLLTASLVVVACASPAPTTVRSGGLSREGAEGPYIAGTTETFSLDVAAGTQVRWSATAGALSGSNARVQWTLPEGVATLTAVLTGVDGQTVNREWSFQVEPAPRPGHATARESLMATPIQVIDGGVETSGNACDVQYDAAGNVHLAFTTSTHPSIFYGRWNGSTWTIEFVDGLGFNVGARVDDTLVALAVEANGTPHLAYIRNTPGSQLWYATKSGANWVRERADSDTVRISSATRFGLTLNPAQSNRPYIAYTAPNASAQDRLAVTQRAAAGMWTPVALPSVTGATSYERVRGDAVFAGGTLVFPIVGSASVPNALVGWTSTLTSYVTVPATVTGVGIDIDDTDLALASASRLIARTRQGVYDVNVGSPFTATTMTWSASTISGAVEGDVAWNGTRPVVMQNLSGSLELATPNAEGYWLWTALGSTSGSTGAMALHPSTGAASICYQSNGHVMFQ